MASRRSRVITAGLLLGTVAVAAAHNVPRSVRPADVAAANALLASYPVDRSRPSRFSEQVKLVLAIQDAVLSAAPMDKGIPHGKPRELADVVGYGFGLCYDRSRAIETVLRSRGFETRHAAIYRTDQSGSVLKALATPGIDSHAVTEVRTSRGWLLVDSNHRWIGLTREGRPVDLAELRSKPDRHWHQLVKDPPAPIFRRPFTWVYGLYSRHGRFYSPYTPIPDVNWRELTENL